MLALAALTLPAAASLRAAEPPPKKVVLIAGAKSHGPGEHEYERGVRILEHCLATSPGAGGVRVEAHLDGWPRDPRTLEDADTILLFSDGSDRDEDAHPLLRQDRLRAIGRQMARGCGLVALHYTVFVPVKRGGDEFLEWIGGFFDYETGPGERRWFSAIGTHETRAAPAAPGHPIARGLGEFRLKEEYYYNIRFREGDPRLVPILTADIPGRPKPEVVAWAVERKDGGRGFGFTGAHFHSNWRVQEFRRLVLNAVLWTARAEVPAGGVESRIPRREERGGPAPAEAISALIVTGHQHPAHAWRETTLALEDALAADRRFEARVAADPEALAREDLSRHRLLVLNYCDWERPPPGEAARRALIEFVERGGGLAIIHFSNGAFRSWPGYRRLCRRVWVEGKSGHDSYGRFRVDIAGLEHPITRGLKPFETTDELYYSQAGDEPIEPLATARSKVTGKDEPMAFAYPVGLGRVFQTVLGHAAESIRAEGAAELIRRGSAWAAGKEPVAALAPPGAPTRPRAVVVRAPGRPEYRHPPLSVEARTRLHGKQNFNILVASEEKASRTHWEIYTYVRTGCFSAYLPGMQPDEIVSARDLVDGEWHDVAMVYEPGRVRLFVDGELVKDAPVSPRGGEGRPGPIAFGSLVSGEIGCDGEVGEVRISRGTREIAGAPRTPFEADGATVGLWRFDGVDGGRRDASRLENHAEAAPPGAAPGPGSTYRLADRELRLVLLDRSPDESFLSLRLDAAGRLFAGGREALFVYEPAPGDGFAPRRELFRFPPDTWISAIEVRGDDLYVMTMSALYLLPGARVRREGVRAERLLWGLPLDLHVSYHGLAFGPEGDLHFTAGDPLLNYGDFQARPDHWGHWTVHTRAEGTRVPFTGQGGFFRVRPDGGGFRVVATGTRGSFGLAFGAEWDLFSSDNDHESLPDRYVPARLLHVAPRADFAWPRGWMAEKTPERADLLETMFAGLGRCVPVGQAYHDDAYLPERYRRSLLVARWGARRIDRYALSPRGASFAAEEHPLLVGAGDVRPVGVAVGRGGRIFAAISYLRANEWSPRYPSDLVMIARAEDPRGSAPAGYEPPAASAERLRAEIEDPSWSRRREAHLEILRRGGALLAEAARRLPEVEPDSPLAAHLPWLAGASRLPEALAALKALAGHSHPRLRLQALRALAEFAPAAGMAAVFERALSDPEPRAVHAALARWFDLEGPLPADVGRLARSEDTYLRQCAALLLARRAPPGDLEALLSAGLAPSRLAGVLAAGFRLTLPEPTLPLPEEVPLEYPAGNALFTIQYADAKVDLKSLGRVGSFTAATRWKVLERRADEERLFALLVERLSDPEEAVRLQAAHHLGLLADPRSEPLIARTREEISTSRLLGLPPRPVTELWVVGPFPEPHAGPRASHPPERGAIDLAAEYAPEPSAGAARLAWTRARAKDRFDLEPWLGADGPACCFAYFSLQGSRAARALLHLDPSAGVRVSLNGKPAAGSDRGPVPLDLESGSNALLLRVDSPGGAGRLRLELRAGEEVAVDLPEKLGLATLAGRLEEAAAEGGEAALLSGFGGVDFERAARDGDPARGRKLFGADALGCARCHAVEAGQAGGGAPSLAGAARRFTVPLLVEAILLPSRQVAPVYRSTYIQARDGGVVTGLVVGETAERLDLLLPDGARQSVTKDAIRERRLLDSSPMPAGVVRTPEELGDLLAFLLQDLPAAR